MGMGVCVWGWVVGVWVCVWVCACMHVCVRVCVHACMRACMFDGSCLATKVFIGNLPAVGKGWVIMK